MHGLCFLTLNTRQSVCSIFCPSACLIEHHRSRAPPGEVSLGIFKAFGWHTFRHSYSTMLRFLGVDIKVQQDLLRHSSARLTLDTYTQAITPGKERCSKASCSAACRPWRIAPFCTHGMSLIWGVLVSFEALVPSCIAPFCTYAKCSHCL